MGASMLLSLKELNSQVRRQGVTHLTVQITSVLTGTISLSNNSSLFSKTTHGQHHVGVTVVSRVLMLGLTQAVRQDEFLKHKSSHSRAFSSICSPAST